MGKRYIDCSARELAAYHKKELLQSIADSEGRVLAAETIGTVTPMLVNITNAEFVTSLGADIIMLNIFGSSCDQWITGSCPGRYYT